MTTSKRLSRRLSRRLSNDKLLRILKFIVKFNVFAIPLYIILFTRFEWVWLEKAVTDITVYFLNGLGFNPTVHDLLISIPIRGGSWAAVINWDCTGWKSMLAFFALVMATDYPARRKAMGLLLIPVIFAINLLRIVFMFFYVRAFDLAYYQAVHTIIWSWGLIITIAALWLLWLRYDLTKIFWKSGRKRNRGPRKKGRHG